MKEYTLLALVAAAAAPLVDRLLGTRIMARPTFWMFVAAMFGFKLLANGYLTWRSGEPAAAGRLAPLAEALERLGAWLHPESDASGEAVLRALSEGLDAEIARWEARSRQDPEARSVLRAFLAVREVLFEMNTRFPTPREPAAEPEGTDTGERSPRARRAPRPRRRVERVAVEG